MSSPLRHVDFPPRALYAARLQATVGHLHSGQQDIITVEFVNQDVRLRG